MPAAQAARCLGRHLLVELRGCDPKKLTDAALVESAMLEAARAARTTVLRALFHTFSPMGVSGVVVIAESHLSIHTWPEHGVAAVDLFTSGQTARPELAVPVLARALGAAATQIQEVRRPWLTR